MWLHYIYLISCGFHLSFSVFVSSAHVLLLFQFSPFSFIFSNIFCHCFLLFLSNFSFSGDPATKGARAALLWHLPGVSFCLTCFFLSGLGVISKTPVTEIVR